MIGVIYKITNNINGKIYVGKNATNNPLYFGSGIILRSAIKKYKKKNFKKEILEYCNSNNQLNEREIYWIKMLNSTDKNIGYNISAGGNGSNDVNLYHKLPSEIKDKIRSAVALSNKTREKSIGIDNFGYKQIEEPVKQLILKLTTKIGRDKIHTLLSEFNLVNVSSKTLTARIHEWNGNLKGRLSNRYKFPINKIILQSKFGTLPASINILNSVADVWSNDVNISEETAIKIASAHIF